MRQRVDANPPLHNVFQPAIHDSLSRSRFVIHRSAHENRSKLERRTTERGIGQCIRKLRSLRPKNKALM
jgi:hypothetical protein